MSVRRWTWLAGVLAVLALAAGWVRHGGGLPQASPSAAPASAQGWALPGTATDDPWPAPSVAALTPEQVRARLFRNGSFQGTEPAGDWCVDHGTFKACAGLRKRFEYYLLGLGEVSVSDIKALVADEARRALGDELAGRVMGLWDRYWQLRTHVWRNQFLQSDRSTWMPVLEEQHRVRREVLGADWADAFFAEDERAFRAYAAQIESGQPPPPDPGEPVPQMGPGKDPAVVHAERVARYGEAAAARLAKADQEWVDWQRRLAEARAEWDRLSAAANLSEAQRRQEMDRYLLPRFNDEEQRRVRALLAL